MNYIKKLEMENADLREVISYAQETVQRYREHLELPKFKGYEENGDRKDWIATGDVDLMMRTLMGLLNRAEDV